MAFIRRNKCSSVAVVGILIGRGCFRFGVRFVIIGFFVGRGGFLLLSKKIFLRRSEFSFLGYHYMACDGLV